MQTKNRKSVNFVKIHNNMKGVTFITDETHKKRFVQIELKTLEKYEQQIEDLLDVIIAESRRDEESISWEKAVKSLKKKGKL